MGKSSKPHNKLQENYHEELQIKKASKDKPGRKKDHSSAIDFMKVALQRNDESIRYSESKAGFLFSLTGIIVGLFYNNLEAIKEILYQSGFWGVFAIIAIIVVVIGVIVVVFATFMVIIPRLRVSKIPTLLYFQYMQSIPENQLYDIAQNLNDTKALKDLTTQVRVTSIIVTKKYSSHQTVS